MNTAILKRGLRWVSSLLVIDRRAYYVHGKSSDVEMMSKCQHYLKDARLVVFSDNTVSDGTRSLRRVNGLAWSFSALRALLFGRILIFDCKRASQLLQSLLYKKIFIVEWRKDYVESAWRWLSSIAPGDTHKLIRKRATEKRTGRSVVLLGSGPSAGLIFSKYFARWPIVSCNTAVKSQRLFEQNVVAHCFVDGTFFFGTSPYSAAFLADLRLRASANNMSLVYDVEAHTFLTSYISGVNPDRLRPIAFNPLVPLKVSVRNEDKWLLTSATNVFTGAMLPWAATHYDEIYLVGFDGKGKDVNYYWAHSDEFQYTDLLGTVKQHDPGFFSNVSFDNYSQQHEAKLASMLNELERQGRRIVMCHSSNIACLNNRYSEPVHSDIMVSMESVPSQT